MTRNQLFAYFFALIVLGSCETVIDVDLPVEPTRLVVNGFINPDSAVTVRISKSKFVLDRAESFTLVEDAQAVLFENGQEITQLNHVGTGLYTSPYRPQVGQQYTIQVDADGLESVEASSEIVKTVEIARLTADSIRRENGSVCSNGDCVPTFTTAYRFQMTFTDFEERDNFYEVVSYVVVRDSFPVFDDANPGGPIEYEIFTERRRAFLISDDPVVSSSEFDFGDGGFFGSSLLFTDDIFSGRSYTLNFTTEGAFGGKITQLTVMLRTLSVDQYEYLRTLQLQEFNEGDPFSEVVPVYNNIENGFGIFAGYSADSVVVDID